METSKKVIGLSTAEQSKLVSVSQVSRKINIGIQAIYKAIREGKLAHTKVMVEKKHPAQSNYKLFTTWEWVEEWRSKLNDKTFQRWNGKLMYNQEKGEISTAQATKILGWTKNKFMYYLNNGHIKYVQKGYYYILDIKDVMEFKERMEQQAQAKEA
jgi:hypothetical protein